MFKLLQAEDDYEGKEAFVLKVKWISFQHFSVKYGFAYYV